MSSRILVLGANGFIGGHLAERLANLGHTVVAGVRAAGSYGHPAIIPVVSPYTSVADFRAVLADVEVVIHAASTSTPSSSAQHPVAELDGNLRSSLALLEALQECPHCRLLYLSSGGTLYGDLRRMAIESDALSPRSFHGAGKAAAEHFVRAFAEQQARQAIILRPSNVYGAGQLARPGFGIVAHAFARALDGQPLTIWGDGSSTRDYLHIDDLIELCVVVLRSPAVAHSGTRASTYNASFGAGTSLEQLLLTIETVSGKKIVREYRDRRPVDIAFVVPDSSAAQLAFGWRPRVDLIEGLQRTWLAYAGRPGVP